MIISMMKAERPLHVVFVISSLGRGGSERQMINLASEMNRRGHRAEIATLAQEGPLAPLARSRGVAVLDFGEDGRRLKGLLRLLRHIRRTAPDIVHPYLPRDNALVTLLKPFMQKSRLVWGVRSADVDWSEYGRRAVFFWKLVVRISRWADLVIANSYFGADFHIAEGFPRSRIVVIPNGIDTKTFSPNLNSRSEVRAQYDVAQEAPVVGMLGRFDPMKGHGKVLDVFALAHEKNPRLHLLVVGLHSDSQHDEFMKRAEGMSLEAFVTLAPETDSPAHILQACDVFVLPSVSEAFPNVVAEALSCGVPVAAFDVGDVKRIVGAFGSVVPRGNVRALADAVVQIAERNFDQTELHDHVERNFSISAMADRTLQTLGSLRARNQGR